MVRYLLTKHEMPSTQVKLAQALKYVYLTLDAMGCRHADFKGFLASSSGRMMGSRFSGETLSQKITLNTIEEGMYLKSGLRHMLTQVSVPTTHMRTHMQTSLKNT